DNNISDESRSTATEQGTMVATERIASEAQEDENDDDQEKRRAAKVVALLTAIDPFLR
ncbi:hypothetical protein PIB30_084054, partial [Stylosanthes scabra]|nr:hypothetical protein [Stylosanthes scabra]